MLFRYVHKFQTVSKCLNSSMIQQTRRLSSNSSSDVKHTVNVTSLTTIIVTLITSWTAIYIHNHPKKPDYDLDNLIKMLAAAGVSISLGAATVLNPPAVAATVATSAKATKAVMLASGAYTTYCGVKEIASTKGKVSL